MAPENKTSSPVFQLTKPDYMAETHDERKGFPVLVEIIKFVVLYSVTSTVLPLVMVKLIGVLAIGLTPLLEMALSFIALGLMGLLFIAYFRLIDRRKVRGMGFVNVEELPKEALLGAVFGFCMFSLCVLVAVLLGGAKFEGVNQGTLGLALIMLPCTIFQSFGEEIMVRGYFLVNVAARIPLWPAVILNGLVFAAMHLQNPGGVSFFMVFNLTMVGILLALLTLRRGSIWAAGLLHSFWNYTQGYIYGLPISGQESGGSTLLQFSLSEGKPLITGGIFGIEASLLAAVVEVLAIILVLSLPQKKTAYEAYAED